MLPTEKRKPIKDLSQEKILAYGDPKIGKSTFFSYAPNALFISTEEGLNHLEVFEAPIGSWKEFYKLVGELEGDPLRYQTVVIDTVDNLYLFCRQYIYEINSYRDEKTKKEITVSHETDMPYGKGWDEVDAEFRRVITRLSKIKTMGLVFISHSEEKEVKKPGYTNALTVISHTLPSRARKSIQPMVDMILYFGFENGRRVIYTKPTGIIDAGDRSGRLAPIIPMEFEAFVTSYYGGDGNVRAARTEIIEQIKKGLLYLSDHKVDNFDTTKRVENSLNSNFGITQIGELDNANITLGALQAYLQKLRAKSRVNGNKNEGEQK